MNARIMRQLTGIDFRAEFHFHPERKWRFDFAAPAERIAVEIEGGTFRSGRHTRAIGFRNDCRKYNAATVAGWRVLRYTSEDFAKGTFVIDVLTLLRFDACKTQQNHQP